MGVEMSKNYNVWTCKIVVPGDMELPRGFDGPPRMGAENAILNAGIPVLMNSSGWGGSPNECDLRYLENDNRQNVYVAGLMGNDKGENITMPKENAHYQTIYQKKLTNDDCNNGFVEILMDPYRVADIYNVDGGPREQILKKSLRWTAKGHTEEKVLREIISAAQRGLDMIEEDRRD